ncbi:MAG: sialidase family protein, partial [Candidatus Latescibacterota bacterium]
MTPCRLVVFAIVTWAGAALAAAPVFENRTPVAFSPQDSIARTGFVAGQEITVRADLNQAATEEYPVIGHFHGLEKSDLLSATDTDGMQVDVATATVVPFGTNGTSPTPGDSVAAAWPTLHMAWIEQSGFSQGRTYNGGITPVYRVMYARSFDGGATFSTPASVCGTVTYHLQTADGSGGSFSTLDLAVDSGGRPRIAYAFVSTADRKRSRNVYLAYSQDGGGTWPTPLTVNDAATVGADLTGRRSCAFPRLAIDDRDEVFVGYVRGTSRGTGTDDVMLAKVNRQASPFSILPIGANGATGTGGVRLTPDGKRHTGPDLAMGDGDVLHVVYFNDTDDRVEHRCLATDTTWVQAGATGWNQDADGAQVSSFVDEAAANASLETDAHYFFPTVVVDRRRTPDRVHALFKYGDNTPTEGIRWNQYDDEGIRGTGATWGTAAYLWSSSLFGDGAGNWGVELDWEITERVAAVVDQRLDDRGDLHIAFTAGYSGGGEHDLYYAYGNGTSWTLPEKVADDDSDGSGTGDGIDNGDTFLLSPALTGHPDTENLFLAFAGRSAEGFGVNQVSSVAHHPYLKVLGRAITWEDQSVPVGGYQYDLTYTPINPHDGGVTVADNPVYVHAADASDGTGLGATGASTDGFLAGDWETVATTLADDDKYYEGLIDEDPSTTNEWGDDDDKVGLLVKLNLLGSDSATNLQLVTNSTASAAGTGKGARTVRVGTDPRGSFTGIGRFFSLGADVDIVAANAAPTLSIAQPDGTGDTANTEFTILYTALDGDDDLGGNLRLALYAYPTGGLRTVQDVRIFGTLIVDENDVPAVNPLGTGDLTEGNNQSYTWDDPPAALRDDALFASILRLRSGSYWIYLVADDGRNPPAFAVSSGPLTLRHGPLVRQVSPVVADTVDTGVRTGQQANPYDLDLTVVDYDSEARVQLFYAAASGIASVSARGTYPMQSFVLGKSVSGTRGTAITDSTSLTTRNTEYAWDVTSPLIGQGSYYLYAVATDSVSTAVGQSAMPLVVRHSPSFVFYEPSRDTQREVDSGSQP